MKRTTYLLLSALAASLVAGSFIAPKNAVKVSADPLKTYIPMEEDSFSDYEDTKGSFAGKDATFWSEEYSFNALDTFFRGETAEGWTGTLTLKPWKQQTRFIYFTWGGANNKRVTEHVDPENLESETVEVLKMKMFIHYGEHVYEKENDTFVQNPMMLRYFEIPEADFDSTQALDMYIELEDGLTADYGFHNFGYLHVNQSEEQVSDAMRYYINHMDDGKRFEDEGKRNWTVNKRKEIYNHYFSNAELKKVFLRTVTNIDEDFESSDDFLNHWYLDPHYDNNVRSTMHVDDAISEAEYRLYENGSNMPYNKSGNSFFKGWHDESNGGFVTGDASTYRFISRPFVLNAKGLVSVKMAGRSASLHLLDVETGKEAWADIRSFAADGDESDIALSGKNVVTMVKHYVNFEKYAGRTVQLAIADVGTEDTGWAAVYFDDLVASYDDYPTSFKVDVVTQTNESGTYYAVYPEQYICSTHIETDPNGVKYQIAPDPAITDETAMYEAHEFLKYYYSTFRTEGAFICKKNVPTVISDEDQEELTEKYNALSSAEVKAIVDASEDYDRGTNVPEEWSSCAIRKEHRVEEGVAFIINGEYKSVLYHGDLFINNSNGPMIIIVITIVTLMTTLIGVVILRKKKSE